MAGVGIQKRGTSPLLVKRKGFVSGGDVDPIEKKPKTFSEGVKEGVKKLGETSSKVVKDVAKGVEEGVKKLVPGTVNTVKKSIEEGIRLKQYNKTIKPIY